MIPDIEFPRPVRAHEIGGQVRRHALEANEAERFALAARFSLLALDSLTAAVETKREAGGIRITGSFTARGSQPCVATGDPVPFLITEPIALLLTEAGPDGTEIELAAPDLDTEPLVGDIVDLGEITAQALALALDPYPRSTSPAPGVLTEEQAQAASSPFAILKKPQA